MMNKKLDIQYAREHTGWAYYEMKWLSEDEAKKANIKRNKLLQSISGRVNINFLGNKISTGQLSPGCMICGRGEWSCLFIGSLCTANCFFCPQDRKNKNNQPPKELELLFDNPDDYVDYLEKFKFKGVSFSGGEPLLQYEKILTFIRKIRERLGKGIYVWLYTNGDLINRDKLIALKEVGLNEIRFDIAAGKYNLKAVELAAGIIDKVTVEIPAVPEDYKILKRCLPRMKAIGVAHLNLHQLFANHYCYHKFVDRHYTFLHQPDIPILESEMTALRLIKYALDNNIGLAINYCCAMYKHRFQKKAYKEKFQPFIKEGYEGLTESRFIRRLTIQGTPVNIKKLVKIFQKNMCRDKLWFLNKNKSELFVHYSLLKYIDFNKFNLIVAYFTPQLTAACDDDKESKKIALNVNRNVYVGKKLVYQVEIINPASIKSFQELFIKKMDSGDVLKRFYRDYELKTKADLDCMMDEKERLDYLKTWEFIGSGLYEIY
jgi:uncharacterized protein